MYAADGEPMNTTTLFRRPAGRLLTALAAVPLLALTAACGDDGEGARAHGTKEVAAVPGERDNNGRSATPTAPAADKSAFYDAQMVYVRCMRTKAGLKDFPDPRLSGYLDWPEIDKLEDPGGRGEKYKGGKDGVCAKELLAAGNLEPERDAQRDYESMLAHAICMRDKGVSRFGNPVMSGGNVIPGGDPNPASPVLDPDSPRYQSARTACAGKLLEGLDGMQ
jgi:hypothetical protein